MNKLFKTLAASVLGLALAAGVGVGVAGGVKTNEVKAGESVADCCDFTTQATGHTSYGDEWTYDTDYTVFGGANNNGKDWTYNKFGAKKSKATDPDKVTKGYVVFPKITDSVKRIEVEIYKCTNVATGSASWSVDVANNSNFTDAVNYDGGTINHRADTGTIFSIIPSSPCAANSFYKIHFDIVNGTTTNGLLWVSKINLITETSGPVSLEYITASDVELLPGKTGKSEITFYPSSADNKNVTYEISSGTDVASVAADGTITALKAGTATLTVTPEDTSAGATAVDATITVNSYPSIEVVEIGKKYAIVSGGKYELSGIESSQGAYSDYSGSPMFVHVYDVIEGAYDNTVAFQSGSKYLQYHGSGNNLYEESTLDAMSSWTVATEDSRLVVRNVADRTRVLTCNTSNHKFNCYANLNQDPVDFVEYVPGIPLESFSFADTMEVKVGLSKSIEVTYVPANASDKTLTWESSDEGVATVSDGTVTGVSEGTAVITASKEGLESQSCTVTVTKLTTHEGTESDPYSVEDAVNVAKAGLTPSSAYVKGLVTKFISSSTYDKCSFWVGDSLEQVSAETGAFEFFQLAGITEESYKLIKVGATVVGCGNITLYGKTAEFAKGGSLTYNSYAVANEFGKSFNNDIAAICAVTKSDAPGLASNDLVEFFDTQALSFELLDEVEQAHFSVEAKTGSKATDLELMLATYDYCLSKYTNLNNFLGREVPSSNVMTSLNAITSNNSTMMIVIVSVAVASISLLGVTIFLKKKRAIH